MVVLSPFYKFRDHRSIEQRFRLDFDKGNAGLFMRIYSDVDGNLSCTLTGINRNILSTVWGNGTVKVMVNGKVVGNANIDWIKVPSRVRSGFIKVVSVTTHIDTTFDKNELEKIYVPIDSAVVESVDKEIEEAGNELRKARVLYGPTSDEYLSASNTLSSLKTKRSDIVGRYVSDKRLDTLSVSCDLECDPPLA